MSSQKNARKIDLSGEVCPWPVIYTLKEIKKMNSEEVLEVITDHVPSTNNIPEAVTKDGHAVLESSRIGAGVYKIVIQVKKK